ncbi:MAG TPA: polymer-forming cytoskeletal protein [Alphaproteobacteria bacterium]|nr:polymer-forming cytoskeletal protein [Alphaproteobacteria bacterium]
MIFRRKKPLSNFEMPRPESHLIEDDDPDLPPLRSMPRGLVTETGLARTAAGGTPTGGAVPSATPSSTAKTPIPPPPPRATPEGVRRIGEAAPAPRKPGGEAADAATEGKKLIVGRDICLNGQITACEHLVVEGRVEAALTDCRKIEIAESGSFKGSAEIESAEISGHFEGTLTARGRLLIRASGRVNGDVRYGRLEIEPGGEINGDIRSLGVAAATPLRRETTGLGETIPAIASE